MLTFSSKPFTMPKLMKSTVNRIAIRAEVSALFLAMDFCILGDVGTIEAFFEQFLVIPGQGPQPLAGVSRVRIVKATEPRPMGNLLCYQKFHAQ